MELLVLIGLLLLLDILATRYGVDSRRLDVRDGRSWWPGLTHDSAHDLARWHLVQLHREAQAQRLVSLATVARPPVRIRLANGLRALAAVLEPAYQVSQ